MVYVPATLALLKNADTRKQKANPAIPNKKKSSHTRTGLLFAYTVVNDIKTLRSAISANIATYNRSQDTVNTLSYNTRAY